MLKNITIKLRLTIVLCLVAFSLIVTGFIGVVKSASVQDGFDKYRYSCELKELGGAMLSDGLQCGQAARNVFIDPNDKKAKENLADAIKKFEEHAAKLKKLDQTGYDSIYNELDRFLGHTSVLLEMADKNETIDIASIKQNTSLWREVKEKILKLKEVQTKSQKSEEETIVSLISFMKNTSIATAALSFFAVSVVLYFIQRSILTSIKMLKEVSSMADELSHGGGDLTRRITVYGSDELSDVGISINKFIDATQKIVQNAKVFAEENASVSIELSQTAANIGKRAEDEAATVGSAYTVATAIIGEIGLFVSKAEAAKNNISSANNVLSDTKKELSGMIGTIARSVEMQTEFSDRLQVLTKDAEQIKEVLSVIGDIADQTNLLALNAAIEAARAGEHGRGFAVVADEVRKLAERTQKSLSETNNTINAIVGAIDEATEQMGKNVDEIKALGEGSVGVGKSIDGSVEAMQSAIGIVDELFEVSYKNANDARMITSNLSQINDMAISNARSVEEIAAASSHVKGLAERLRLFLDGYRA